jgi:hypothetical protein
MACPKAGNRRDRPQSVTLARAMNQASCAIWARLQHLPDLSLPGLTMPLAALLT